MIRSSSNLFSLVMALAALAGCSEPDPAAPAPDSGSGTGGGTVAGSGGSMQGGSAGMVGVSGSAGSGGAAAGSPAMGGAPSGGTSGTSAVGGSGPAGTGGAAGSSGTGGVSGTGAGMGGAPAGGAAGSGGAGAGNGGAGAGGNGGAGAGGAGGGNGGAGAGGAGGSGSAVCPPGITQTITVAKSGGDFTTVQAAVDSIASGSSAHVRIDIKAGTYKEKLTIASRTNLCLVGESTTTTILTYDDSNSKVGSTSGSASVLVSANDFSAANLTIENSFGSGNQAVALRTTGQRQQFLNCRFVGYQDTLYTHQGIQYFKNCYVQGNTDYVFGGATAVLENCEVRNVEGGSAVSAPNTDIGMATGIVFLGGTFTAVSSVNANSVALGRPWGVNGAAAYLNVNLGAHIASAGFVAMSGNDPLNARFREYQSTGPGANPSAHATYQMNATEAANYSLANVFGSWVPSYSQ